MLACAYVCKHCTKVLLKYSIYLYIGVMFLTRLVSFIEETKPNCCECNVLILVLVNCESVAICQSVVTCLGP